MGLNTTYLHFIESSIEQSFGGSVSSLRMLELGDQVIVDQDISIGIKNEIEHELDLACRSVGQIDTCRHQYRPDQKRHRYRFF